MTSGSDFLIFPCLQKYGEESTSLPFGASSLDANVPLVFETLRLFAFDRVSPAWDNLSSWSFMISKRVVLLLSLPILAALPAAAQQNLAPPSSPAAPVKSTSRGDADNNSAIVHDDQLQHKHTIE